MHKFSSVSTKRTVTAIILLALIFLTLGALVYLLYHKDSAPEDTSAATTNQFTISKINYTGRVAVGDIDGDGKKDIVINEWGSNRGTGNNGNIKWFKNPSWQEYTINVGNFWGDSVDIANLRGDGKVHVIGSKGSSSGNKFAVYSYSLKTGGSPTNAADWVEQKLFDSDGLGEAKDMAIKDFDKDGRLDIMLRHSKRLKIFYQENDGSWKIEDRQINNAGSSPEGLGVMDIDGDGYLDAIMEGYWLANPKGRSGNWQKYEFDTTWQTGQKANYQGYSVKVAIGDFDGDGKNDFAVSQSEDVNFPIKWYQLKAGANPKNGPSAWNVKTVDASTEYQAHTLQAADFNGDGHVDLLSAGLPRLHKEHYLYINKGNGNSFEKTKISGAGSAYSSKVADLNGDNKPDIVSPAIWDKNEVGNMLATGDVVTKVLINNMPTSSGGSGKRRLDLWDKVEIGNSSDRRLLAVDAVDVDGDGKKDIVSSSYWWKQPANIKGSWTRNSVASGFNFFHAGHFNSDNKLDLLGSSGNATNSKNMVWAKSANNSFTILSNVSNPSLGDFPQGVAEVKIGNDRYIAMSWHDPADHPMQFFKINGESGQWPATEVSAAKSQNEDLSVGDIDGDGDEDIFQGTKWLRNNATVSNWSQHTIDATFAQSFPGSSPDRNVLHDFDGDGLLDAVVGLEEGTKIIFYKNPGDLKNNPNKAWTRTVIYEVAGQGFSMDAGDIDHDGDIDIVIGEHRGPTVNRVIILENQDKTKSNQESNWKAHIVDSGAKEVIDHHVGTQLVDIDNDGDLDIISIGWYNQKVWLYINTATSTAAPTATATPVPPTSTAMPSQTLMPTNTQTPNTVVPSTTGMQGNICGKADADGDGVFKIYDFGEFAKAYGNGKNTCADRNVDYGPCGGRDVNRDGFLNIGDFGTTGTGFAQRYYPKTSCALN